MTQETAVGGSELEQLQRRFEEYRSVRPSRGRSRKHCILDYASLKKRMAATANREASRRTKETRPAADFLELIQPATSASKECHIEVETSQGAKVRVELRGIATNELAALMRGFLGW